jgi:hypothetical protein
LGGTALAHDFGLRLSAAGARLRRLQFDYGGPAAPFPAEGDRTYAGPRLQLQVTRDRSPDEAHGAFTRAMIEDGILPVRRYQPEDALWRRAWYCTFGDQMGLAKALDAAHPTPASSSPRPGSSKPRRPSGASICPSARSSLTRGGRTGAAIGT